MSIAKTIMEQIGNRAFMMIGGKNFIDHDGALSFKIGRNSKSVNYVKVTLNAMDTYDIVYSWVTKNGIKERSRDEGMYFDMLRDSIERNTGMYTSF